MAIPPLSINFTLKKLKKHISKKSTEIQAKEIYEIDNSIGNLESDLNSFFEKNNKNKKFVFIIDELDKLDQVHQKIDIFKIVQSFKNLFTIAKANFVFITDQKIYTELLEKNREEHTYPTLFTNKYFIIEPSLSELHEYFKRNINNILIGEEEINADKIKPTDKKTFNHFINYLIYINKMDFFALKNHILDILEYDSDFNPIVDTDIVYNMVGKKNIELYSTMVQLLYQIYSHHQYANFSKMHINKENLKLLFGFSETIIDNKVTYNTQTKEITFIDLSGTSVKYNKAETDDYHYLDFLDLLARYNVFSVSHESTTKISTYNWTNKVPDVINDMPNLLFKNENEFVNHFKYFTQIINDIDDMENDNNFGTYDFISEDNDASTLTSKNTTQIYNKYSIHYKNFKKDLPVYIQPDTLKKITKELLDINPLCGHSCRLL